MFPKIRRDARKKLGKLVIRSNIQPKWSFWATPLSMVGYFLAGISFAVLHHVYYQNLDDTLIGSTQRQQWPIRYEDTPLSSN